MKDKQHALFCWIQSRSNFGGLNLLLPCCLIFSKWKFYGYYFLSPSLTA